MIVNDGDDIMFVVGDSNVMLSLKVDVALFIRLGTATCIRRVCTVYIN